MTPLSRRSVLRGIGATVALPFLDAMVPARRASAASLPRRRLVCVEMVHGSAGSSAIGVKKNLWAPAAVGREFDLSPTSLRSLEPFRDILTIVSNTDVDPANPFTAKEIGGDHFRSSCTFFTQAHPRQTQGGDVHCGISLDQLFAQRFGQETAIPSMQLCIENVDAAGGCGNGYSCVYTDPRVVFDQMFGVLANGATQAERAERLAEDRSILDWLLASAARLAGTLGPADRSRLADYLEHVREIERRIQIIEARNRSGDVRELPEAPVGVPDSFGEHVKLMFDLQVLAFASDITRVFAFKLGRDASNRSYPESGFKGTFHDTSHHGGKEEKVLNFATLNTYHVGLMPYLLEKLKNTPDGDGSLLDHTLLIYGSPMGDSNLHNHKRVPFFMAGRAGGALPGGLHLKAPSGTPLANVMLSVLHAIGLEDLERFGDSEGAYNIGHGQHDGSDRNQAEVLLRI